MVVLDIISDENLGSLLKRVMSGMLPHKNYDGSQFGIILQSIIKYIKIDEMEMEYYIFFSTADKMLEVSKNLVNVHPVLGRETFTAILENNILDVVRRDKIGLKKWLDANGYPSNLEISEPFKNASQMLFKRSLDLYDESFALEMSSEESLGYLPALESAFLINAAEMCVRQQSLVLKSGVWDSKKRALEVGPVSWLDYIGSMSLEIRRRISVEEESYTIDSVMKANESLDRLLQSYVPIAKWGIPPLDDTGTPILRHRYTLLAGQENIGKTILANNFAAEVLCEKGQVCYFSKENDKDKVFASILPAYIIKKYGIYLTYQMILHRADLPLDKQKIVALAITEVVDGGLLRIIPDMNYYNVYQIMKNEYDKAPFDLWIIDHSSSLSGGGEFIQKIPIMSMDIVNFRLKYPVHVLLLSHTSTSAKSSLRKKRKELTESPSRNSSAPSNDADEVLVIYSNEELERKNLLGMINYKRREAAKIVDTIYLTRRFAYSTFDYDPEMQKDWAQGNVNEILAKAGIDDEDDDEE